MNISISKIKKPFSSELSEFDQVFKNVISSNVRIIDTVAKYIIKYKGKGLRPLLVIMSAKLVGIPNYQTYLVASVVELLHTASLVHDDVVDDAKIRRGFPSINAVWKNKIAVLMGDYLLSKCLISAIETSNLQIMRLLADVSKRLSSGELSQIEFTRKMDINEEKYIKIISDKTAALISSASELGAMTVSIQQNDYLNLRNYGENLGISFQIKDDLLDFYGHQKILGKPVGNDFDSKKITLPLIAAFNNSSTKEMNKIKSMLRNGVSKKDKNYIFDFVFTHKGIEYAESKCSQYSLEAKNCLVSYPDSMVKDALLNLTDYVVSRKK